MTTTNKIQAVRSAYRRGGATELASTTRRWASQQLDPGPRPGDRPPAKVPAKPAAAKKSPAKTTVKATAKSPVKATAAGPGAKARGANPNPLETYFKNNTGRRIHKWQHYFEIYDRHFARFRGRPVTVVEFGVAYGGSLEMWRDYFGPRARIIGVDITEACRAYAGDGIEIFIGDQADREFLRKLAAEIGPIHVLIEDGGHRMNQQITTFEELYPHVVDNGVLLVEDVHTSYISNYDGGYKLPGTFVEYVKDLYDQLHAWHSRDEELTVTDFTRSTRAMHLYPGVVVFERGRVFKPKDGMTGTMDR